MRDQRTAEQLTGELVRHHRIARGYSQQVVADSMVKLGFSWRQTTVAKTEAAERPIRVNELTALARVLDLQAHQLVEEPEAVTGGRLMVELLRAQSRLAEAEEVATRAVEEYDAAKERFDQAQARYTAAERERNGQHQQEA